jgi:exopolyphosphatase/guanosine-5'-triphosphate,3'-diphosphate pyrophosphatase
MNEPDAREEMLAFMREKEARPAHVQQVARLALQLFDQLAVLHGLGGRERLLLEAAAHLHDIGHATSPPGSGHHHEAARMIREHPWKHFNGSEVEVIAQAARYHRKAMPDVSHEEFKTLNEWDRRVVQCLAALLRLADAFDRSHAQHIERVMVDLPVNRIVLRLESPGPVLREVQAAHLKGDLARLVFQRDLVFMFGDEEMKPPQ